ncbi:hypothetical protein A3Q56_08788, partial [Intoshia linei]
VLNDCGLIKRVVSLSYDMTSANTGRMIGSVNYLPKNVSSKSILTSLIFRESSTPDVPGYDFMKNVNNAYLKFKDI